MIGAKYKYRRPATLPGCGYAKAIQVNRDSKAFADATFCPMPRPAHARFPAVPAYRTSLGFCFLTFDEPSVTSRHQQLQ